MGGAGHAWVRGRAQGLRTRKHGPLLQVVARRVADPAYPPFSWRILSHVTYTHTRTRTRPHTRTHTHAHARTPQLPHHGREGVEAKRSLQEQWQWTLVLPDAFESTATPAVWFKPGG